MQGAKALAVRLLLLVLAVPVWPQAAGFSERLTDAQHDWLVAHPELSMAVQMSNAPLQSVDANGVLVGVSGDYARLVEARLGIRLRIVPVATISGMIDEISHGRVDILIGVTGTADRQALMNFTSTLYQLPQVLITSGRRSEIRGLDDLKGGRTTVVRGTSFEEWLRRVHPEIPLVPQDNVELCMQSLAVGQVDAYVGSLATASYSINRLGIGGMRVVSEVGAPIDLRIAVRKDMPALVDILDRTITSITPAEHKAIRDRWLSVGQSAMTSRALLRVLIPAAGALILLGGVLLLVLLRREAMKRRREEQLRTANERLETLVRERTAALGASEARLRAFLETAPDGIISLNEDSLIEDCNPAALSIFGYAREELIGKHVQDIVTDPTPHRQGGPAGSPRERSARRKDGTPFEIEYTVSHVEVGGTRSVTVVFRDVTPRKELERAHRYLADLVDSSRDAIVGLSLDGIVLSWNPGARELYGYASEEIIGRSASMLVAEEEKEEVRSTLARVAQGQTLSSFESRGLTRDGRLIELTVAVSPVYDAARQVIGASTIAHDISQLKAAEREVQRSNDEISDLYNHAPCGYHSLDKDGMFLRINDTELGWLGYSREELVGRTRVLDILTPQSQTTFKESFPMFIQRGWVTDLEMDFVKKDGTIFPAMLSGTAIRDREGTYAASRSTLFDNTERRRLLEDLREASRIANEANQAKSIFLANMSHEIRTPMNAVIGFAGLALKTDLSPQQRDYVAKIHNAGISLLGLINDILDFSKIEADRLSIEHTEFALDTVMESVSTSCGHEAFSRGIELLVHVEQNVPQALIGDSHRVRQVLLNLTANAVKFTEQGEVEIGVMLAEAAGDKVKLLFQVRDTGIGMSDEQASHLFRPFSQADSSTTRKYGGTGLGLSICRRLVELMGGQIWVRSAVGKGSTFSFTVWLGVDRESVPQGPNVPGHLEGMRVLVADDNPTARRVLQEILESMRFRVEAVTSGELAVEEVRIADTKDPYRLVLMDWKMPGMDGIDAIRHITNGPALNNRPMMVILSASGGGGAERDRALAAGAVDFLVKPLTPSTLFDAILRLFAPEVLAQIRETPIDRTRDHDLAGAHVLLVEDNDINQQIATELLNGVGAEVEIAATGREALERLARGGHPLDVILMDIQMPEMDGYEATRRIRAGAITPEIPVIAMTAHAMMEERQRALEAGMNDHVSKPIDPDALFETIARYYHAPVGATVAPRASAPSTGFPTIAGVDTRAGIARVAGNTRLYRELLGSFVSTESDAAERIATSLHHGDSGSAERFAHTVKGTAANLGIDSVQEAAGKLEQGIRVGQTTETIESHRAELDRAMKAASTLILAALDSLEIETGPADAASETGLEETERQLRKLIEDSDSEAVNYLDLVRRRLERAYSPSDVDELRRLLRAYDFASALAILVRSRAPAE